MMDILFVILFSLALGSFGNNVISYFISGIKLDVLHSKCFCGKHKLKTIELIPLVSYFIQNGKCDSCTGRISFRYPLVELLSVIIGLLIYSSTGFTPNGLLIYLIAYILLLISVIDYYKLIIPNNLLFVLLGFVIAFLLIDSAPLINRMILSLALLTVLYIIQQVFELLKKKEVMGAGDLKLIFVLTLLLDISSCITAIWISSLLALVFVIISNKFRLNSIKEIKVPFGLYLSVGFMMVFIFNLYSETVGIDNIIAAIWK